MLATRTSPMASGSHRTLLSWIVAILVTALLATPSLALATPASAAPTARVMATTQRMSDASLTSTLLGWHSVGTVLELICFKRGQAVKGYFSPYLPNGGWDDLWYQIADGSFVADVDIETGSNNPVTGQCPTAFASAPNPSVSGTVAVGATLSAATGGWNPIASFAYQWLLNSSPVPGATGATWTVPASAIGLSVSVRVTGSASGYISTTRTSAARGPVAAGTLAAPTPVISGTPTVGKTLSATAGAWGPTPVTLTYQWLRNGSPISGATAATLALTTADAGRAISVRVTGSKTAYTGTSQTSAAVIVGLALTSTPTPTISGTGKVGQTLTAAAGSWGPGAVTLAYQWLRNGSAIAGAKSQTYTLVAGDALAKITVRVTGSRSGYTSVSQTSTAKSVEGVLVSSVPTLAGNPTVAQTLTANPGTWGPAPVTLTYQWLRNGSAISGATSSTYVVKSADASATISVRVSGTKTGYTSASRTSSTLVIGKAMTSTPQPTISGKAEVGRVLTVSPGTWGPAPVTLAFQWLRGGTAISGATAQTYTLTAADAAQAISVRVTGTKTGYTKAVKTSTALTVATATLTPATPTISGSATANSTLTANAGTWGPTPVSLSYSWSVAGTAVSGATGTTWTVPSWAAGKPVTVTVTGSKPGYSSQSRTSAAVTVSRDLGSRLAPGSNMVPDSYLRSPNGQYTLAMQGDGNLVLYRGSSPLWASNTSGQPVSQFAVQTDSNLVIYRTDGRAIWASNTAGRSARDLVLQDDGNLVLYNTSGAAIWASNTAQGGGSGSGGGRLIVPFASGVTWYVCQGYNGSITHGGNPDLDLTTYSGRGSTGCWGGENAAAGQQVVAPGAGSLIILNNGLGGSCINLDGGGSIYLGHLNYSRGNGRVGAGDPIGTVAAAGSAGNNGYAHLHLSARSGSGCGGTKVPFTSSNNMKIQGMPELTYSGAANQWAGQAFRR